MLKPSSGAKLNLSHPLAKSLVGCWLMNEGSGTQIQDYTGNNHGTLVTGLSASWDANDKGRILKTTALDQWINLGQSDRIFRHFDTSNALKTMTIIHGYKKTESSGLQNGNAFGPRVPVTSTSSFLNAQIPNSVASVVWAVGGTTSGTHFVTASGANLDNDVWAFVNGPQRGMEIWQNGGLKSSASSQNPGWTSTSANFALGKSITDTVGYDGDYGEHNFFFVYNRVLSLEDIQWISTDPFTLFERRLWYVPAFVDYPSGGVVGASSAVLEGIKVALGGTVGGGSAKLNIFDIVEEISGGAVLGGTASVGVTYANVNASGGVVAAGVGDVDFYDIVEDLSGGAVVGGVAHVNHTRILAGSGGAVVGGAAVQNFFDYENGSGGAVVGGTALHQLYSANPSTGGAVCAGTADVSIIIVGLGGAVCAGTATITVDYYQDDASGAVCGGTQVNTMNMSQIGFSQGVKGGGKGVVYRKRRLRTVRSGYGRALNSDNPLKQAEADKLVKESVMIYLPVETPELEEDRFQIDHESTWCDVEDRCSEGCLPAIVEQRQGQYMPPKKV